MQVTPAGGPWGCHESGQRPSCHPAGAGHLRGRGCGHCVPAPPIGGQRHLVSPAAGSSGCPSLDHRPGRVCVPKPVTSRMGKPSREGQEQTETTNTHTQSPRGFVFLRRGFSCLKPLRQMVWFPAFERKSGGASGFSHQMCRTLVGGGKAEGRPSRPWTHSGAHLGEDVKTHRGLPRPSQQES